MSNNPLFSLTNFTFLSPLNSVHLFQSSSLSSPCLHPNLTSFANMYSDVPTPTPRSSDAISSSVSASASPSPFVTFVPGGSKNSPTQPEPTSLSPFSPFILAPIPKPIATPSFASTANFTPALGLRGQYNSELRNREEWVRISPMLTSLKTMTETPPEASRSDFTFQLVHRTHPMKTFDTLRQTQELKLSVLLLTPTRFLVANRRQTGVNIQKFAEAKKLSVSIIIYLMDVRSSGEQQVEAVQSLGALHHCLALGVAEAPPVLVVPDASYLLDCIEGYMRSLLRVNPVPMNVDEKLSPLHRPSPKTSKTETENPFMRAPQ